VQSNSIKYACVERGNNSYKQEITESDYNTFTTKSNVRTVTNPLNFINSRNGVPLESESVFENPVYFKDGTFSSVNENGSYQTGAGDLELLDINSTSDYYHDVKLSRDKNLISFKFETVADCALMTTVLGIAVDIDVPSFDNDCDITYDEEENQFTVSGTLTNTTDLYDVGVLSPIFTFVYDSNMTVTSYDARVTSLMEDDSAKYERTLSRSDIKVDKDTHSISFDISGTDDGKGSSGINTKTDTLYYTITLVPNSIEEYYDNEQYISGTLYSSGTDTGLYLDKIAAKTFRNTLEGVVTKKSLSGKIIWDDDNDKNGYRPEKVEVSLCMDSVAINTQDITGRGNIWEYSFDDLSKYKTFGYEYDYTSEIKKEYDHYTISYDGNDITLTLEEKYVPDNNVITDSLKCGETIISDMSLSKIGLSDLNEAYGITSNFTDAFTDKVREE
jgi:hypothetical protein